MTDELAARRERGAEPTPTPIEMADGLAEQQVVLDRMAGELKRLGGGLEALRDAWAASSSAYLRFAALSIDDLLCDRRGG